MITSLHCKNLTVFSEASFKFGRQLNVIIGENGVGKSHVLKTVYSAIAVSAKGEKASGSATPTKAYLQTAIANKLRNVFKPDELGRLARRKQGGSRCEITCNFAHGPLNTAFAFNKASKSEVEITKTPTEWAEKTPVYLPTRELLTIYPGFVSLYEETHLPFEETWRDTCVLLGAPLAKGPREKRVKEFLEPLEKAMGGTVELDKSGRFYLNTKSGSMEMHLVAEGLRKLAMLARLIATGSLLDKGYLVWDEPEANLNPKVIRTIATTVLHLSKSGIQVFIATHSLYLLKELHIQSKELGADSPTLNYFVLGKDEGEEGGATVQAGTSIEELSAIASLDAELEQADRFRKWL